MMGCFALASATANQTRKQNHRSNEANDNGAIPSIFNAAPRCYQGERTNRSSNKRNSPIVKIRKGFALAVHRQQYRRNGNGKHRKRNIDPECPTPADQVGEDSAQKRTNQHGHRPTDSHNVQIQGAFTRWNDVCHDCLGKHQQATVAQTSHSTASNEHRHIVCRTAHDRTNQEQHRRNDEQALPADHVAHFAIHRHSYGAC